MTTRSRRPTALFICGSLNQTTQMHQVARALPEVHAAFSPYYCNTGTEILRRIGALETTISGNKHTGRCLDYLREHDLTIDFRGLNGGYELAVTSSDVLVPKNLSGVPLVAVQEGILDPDTFAFSLVRRFPKIFPRWIAGTAATGLSCAYERFCVASEGYKDWFAERGAPRERMVVTGLPNFDDCASFLRNDFPHRGYVLVLSSDTRETLKFDSRRRFLGWARDIAKGRPTLFKLHPNELVERATREVARYLPQARVLTDGPTDAMIANADVVITQYSSTAFVALALGKEVHSYFPVETLRRLIPVQNRSAARNIAAVCRDVLAARSPLRLLREVA